MPCKKARKSFRELTEAHKKEYQDYFNRVRFDITGELPDTIPTDKRLQLFKETKTDPHLVELIFQYGRYLLISSLQTRDHACQSPGHLDKQDSDSLER